MLEVKFGNDSQLKFGIISGKTDFIGSLINWNIKEAQRFTKEALHIYKVTQRWAMA